VLGLINYYTQHFDGRISKATEGQQLEILMDAADSRPVSLFSETDKLKNIDAVFGIMDFYTRDHARRVAIYAMRLARRVGLLAACFTILERLV
jgi:HD-GYP domain-containing protein (c-di-GMP phosphodiesterase class II)